MASLLDRLRWVAVPTGLSAVGMAGRTTPVQPILINHLDIPYFSFSFAYAHVPFVLHAARQDD